MKDDDFYKLASDKGMSGGQVPIVPPPTALDEAKERGKNYQEDGKIYIVRGNDLFVVSSKNISVDLKPSGYRDISIKSARMVKK